MESIRSHSIAETSVGTTTILLREARALWGVLTNYEVWFYIAYNDLRSRYRRTVLGPLWLVLANAIMIVGMGLIWSLLFKMELTTYFPKLTAAMISWILLSLSITEAGNTFIQQAGIIQNLPIPIYLHPLRLVSRNVISFLHNFIIFIGVALFFRLDVTVATFLFPVFLFLVVFNLFTFTFIFGLIGARFRDFPQIVSSLMSVLIFVTPVMWDAEMLGKYAVLAYLNPLAHFVFVLKMPLLGELPPLVSIYFLIGCSILSFILMVFMSNKYSHRVAFWV